MGNRPGHNELPENALVGDEQVYSVDPAPEYNEYKSQDEAQGGGTVDVHEVAVRVDKVVLDPDSPEAVQIPDAGRGKVDLPIHQLASPSPEQQLASGDAEEGPAEEDVTPLQEDNEEELASGDAEEGPAEEDVTPLQEDNEEE
jgi:hypothetical protein